MRGPKINMGDVARVSGVSRATVDRVLHKRPGVSARTVRKVEEALQSLGYAPSALHALEQQSTGRLMVMVSSGTNPFFKIIRDGVEQAIQKPGVGRVDHQIVPFDPYEPQSLVTALDAVPHDVTTLVTIGCDVPEVARAIDALVDRGVRVVTMISDVPRSRRAVFVGQDNFAAGRTAARLMARFLPPGPGQIGILLGHYQFRHLMDRMAGFRQTLGLLRPELGIIQPAPYGNDPQQAMAAIAEMETAGDALRGVYITGGGQPVILSSLSECDHEDLVVLGHELSQASRAALLDGRLAALLAVNMNQLAQRALDAAMDPGFDPDEALCDIHLYLPENLPG